MKSTRILLTAAVLVLGVAIGLVVYGTTRIPAPRFTGSLRELLPPPPPGWTMKEKPIANSPEMQEAVGEILNFDDGVLVDYTNSGGERLSVYIAHWTPGKMSHRLVATHTPDVCWVGSGWKKAEARPLDSFQIGEVTVPTGENRIFTADGTPEYVWFWHLVGDQSKSYGTGSAPPWHAAITDLFRKGLNQREEQFFIRISSNSPLSLESAHTTLNTVLKKMPW